MNLLTDELISIRKQDGSTAMASLSGVLAMLVRNEVADYPAMRPHQYHPWHAMLVQISALAALAAGSKELPDDAATWSNWLLGLTPDWPGGEAWALFNEQHDQPAFMQPPVPGGDIGEYKKPILAPDGLDILVTARNHDIKQDSIASARPEHWIFALMMLQTQEGFTGRDNYGISRMNGGSSNRPFFGIRPSGGAGRWYARDVQALLATRDMALRLYDFFKPSGGSALLWLTPWNGDKSLRMQALDPWYVDVCRRVRIVYSDVEGLQGWMAPSRVARIDSKALAGNTGDPWTPLVRDGENWKALTAGSYTFGYRNLVKFVYPDPGDGSIKRAPLQEVRPDDDMEGLCIRVSTLVRGQGKTEGYFQRDVPVSRVVRQMLLQTHSDTAAKVAAERVQDASTMSRKILYPAVLTAYTGAPVAGERKRDDDTARNRANLVIDDFERSVDLNFFEALNTELDHSTNEEMRSSVRGAWLSHLADLARERLNHTLDHIPGSAARSYRIKARASLQFQTQLSREFGSRMNHKESGTEAVDAPELQQETL